MRERLEREADAAWLAVWMPHAESGDAEGQFQVGWFYGAAGDDEESRRKSESWLRKAAEQGHAEACLHLSWLTEGEERKRWTMRAAELGCPHAQHQIGAEYATGAHGLPEEPVLAAQWYRRAAEQGHAESQSDLGFMCLVGEGVERNLEEGLDWLRRATEPKPHKLSNPVSRRQAIEALAEIYRKGHYGVSPDPEQASFWESLLME